MLTPVALAHLVITQDEQGPRAPEKHDTCGWTLRPAVRCITMKVTSSELGTEAMSHKHMTQRNVHLDSLVEK